MKSIIKSNSGDSIKNVASAVLGIGIFVSFVAGCVPAVTFSKLGRGGVAALLFVLILVGGSLIAGVIYVFLNGFGEIVQYTAESATYLETIKGSLAQTNHSTGETEKTVADVVKSITATKSNSTSSNMIKCEVCGTMNHYRNKACISCGHSFEH
ncbi:MAG: zinc finger Ran-binding domain-containing protein [Ruminococcus sp.]|nr:zinc finger Ran-binding domain-containing protein [Ruminococcus sp.]